MSPFRRFCRWAAPVVVGSASLASAAVTVELSGTVNSIRAVTATPTAAASTLNLGGEGVAIGEQIVKVATLSLVTNNAEGLTLQATSGNLGHAGVTVAYKVSSVAANAAAPLSAAFNVASGSPYSYSNDVQGTESRDLYIAYTPPALLDPGVYTGSIVLTVTDDT